MAFQQVVGTAIAYLDLDTSKFTTGLATAKTQLASLSAETTTLSSGMQTVGNAVTTTGATMTKTLTPVLALVSAAGVKASMDLETSLSSVKSKLMSSSDDIDGDMQKLKEAAIDLGGSTKFTAEEVANAFDYMALAGWNTNQMLDAIPGVLDLAASSGMDLARASDVITDYLSAFNKESSYAINMADMLAYAQANTNTTADQLAEAFSNTAVNANGMGQEMSTTISMLSQMAQEGLKGSEAGTALSAAFRDMMQKSMKMSSAEDIASAAADGLTSSTGNLNDLLGRTVIQIGNMLIPLDDLNGSFRDMYDIIGDMEKATAGLSEVDRRSALMMTFTSRSIKAMEILLNEGSNSVRNFTNELENSQGTATEMSEELLNNLSGSVTLLTSALNAFLINVGDRLAPYIRKAADAITALTQKINNMSDAQFDFYVKLGLILMVAGPILMIVGKLITTIGTIIGLVTKFGSLLSNLVTLGPKVGTAISSAFSNMGASIGSATTAVSSLAATIGGIVAVIGGVATAAVSFFKMWNEGFSWAKEAVMVLGIAIAAIGAIILGVPAAVAAVIAAVVALVATAVIVVKDHWEDIKEAFFTMGERIKEHWENICNWFKEKTQAIGDWFKDKIESIKNWFKDTWNSIKTFVSEWFDNIKSVISENFANIREKFVTWFQRLLEKIREFFGTIADFVSGLFEKIGSILEKGKEGLVSIVHNIGDALGKAFDFIFGNLFEKIKNLGQTLLNVVKSVVDSVGNIFETMKSIISEVLSTLGGAIMKLVEMITNGVKTVLEGMRNIFQSTIGTVIDLLTKITKSIGEAFTKALDFINEKISSIWETIKSLPEKFFEFGKNIITKMWDGLKSVWEGVKNWFDEHFGWMVDLVNNIIDKVKSIGNSDLVQKAKGLFSGSHANGLDYVPYDGYVAELHKGERVLTKSENENYGQSTKSSGDTFIFNNTKDDPYEYAREIKRMKKELAFA